MIGLPPHVFSVGLLKIFILNDLRVQGSLHPRKILSHKDLQLKSSRIRT
jgi:hypothetical protein